MPSANTHRNPVFASAPACRPILLENSTIVVVPVRIASSAPTVTINVASSPWSRLPALHRELRGIGKAEVLVEAAFQRGAKMRVTVDEARHEGLAAAVVDIRVRILLQDRIRRSDRGDAVALHRERDVFLNGIGIDHHRVGKHDGPARGLLRLRAAWIE